MNLEDIEMDTTENDRIGYNWPTSEEKLLKMSVEEIRPLLQEAAEITALSVGNMLQAIQYVDDYDQRQRVGDAFYNYMAAPGWVSLLSSVLQTVSGREEEYADNLSTA